MPRTKSQGKTEGSRTTVGKQSSWPAVRVKLDHLDRVDIRELEQVCTVTHLDLTKGLALGPQAHRDLFREAVRRLAQLRWEIPESSYAKLVLLIEKLHRQLGQRVSYFAVMGRYRVSALPAA